MVDATSSLLLLAMSLVFAACAYFLYKAKDLFITTPATTRTQADLDEAASLKKYGEKGWWICIILASAPLLVLVGSMAMKSKGSAVDVSELPPMA